MEGGIEYLRDVIVDDKLGICAELERQMQHLVDTYKCEWTEVVNDPEKRQALPAVRQHRRDRAGIEFVTERGQKRPADWPKDCRAAADQLCASPAAPRPRRAAEAARSTRCRSGSRSARWPTFPMDGGATIKYGESQIAVFHFTSRGEWYACQNMCPHKQAFVLSRGILGSQGETPKVACPLHKKTFSLESGECLSGEDIRSRSFR